MPVKLPHIIDYVRHVYPWHSHEDVSLGVVMTGAVSLATRRHSAIAHAGSLVVVNSEDVHRGYAVGGAEYRCRTIHLHPNAIREVADNLTGLGSRVHGAVHGPAVHDPKLADDLLKLHVRSEAGASPLDLQSRTVALITGLLTRHGEASVTLPGCREAEAVDMARSYLEQHLADKISLVRLSQVVGLPPFRILRAFERATGLTPHAFQTQARVRMAQRLIRGREPLAFIAVATGFADQAHMTRVFKSIMGATPGQFRAANG
jgi:AraC-like DNA-binding protein